MVPLKIPNYSNPKSLKAPPLESLAAIFYLNILQWNQKYTETL